jgi:hypothetical protein
LKWGPVQPRLPGFLDMLQLKNRGQQGPEFLDDTVTPIIDVSALYAFDRRELVTGSLAAAANVRNSGMRVLSGAVPSGEVWMLWSCVAHLNFTTATCTRLQVWDLCPAYSIPSSSSARYRLAPTKPVFDSTIDATWPDASSNYIGCSHVYDRPVLIPGGAFLGVLEDWVAIDAVNPLSYGLSLQITRLQA